MDKENYFTSKNICIKSKKFLQKLKAFYRFPRIRFSPDASALLIIDMQRYFLEKDSHAFLPAALAIIPNIKKLISIFSKKKDRLFLHSISIQEETPECLKNGGMISSPGIIRITN